MDNFRQNHTDRSVDREKAYEWSLVLDAMDIPYELRRINSGEKGKNDFIIVIQPENMVKAEYQIDLYENENYGDYSETVISAEEKTSAAGLIYTILVCFAIYMFQFLIQATDTGFHWFNSGSTSSGLIVKGEWWRSVTALTLHADMSHVLSNMALLCFSAYALCNETGIGLGWFMILVSGAGGNLLNAFVHGSSYLSIGSSTGVFGSIGIVAGFRLFSGERNRLPAAKEWIPMAGALALLGFLGTGNGADLGGHFFGFLLGVFLGIILRFSLKQSRKPGRLIQILLGTTSLIIVIICWIAALNFSNHNM